MGTRNVDPIPVRTYVGVFAAVIVLFTSMAAVPSAGAGVPLGLAGLVVAGSLALSDDDGSGN